MSHSETVDSSAASDTDLLSGVKGQRVQVIIIIQIVILEAYVSLQSVFSFP